MAASTVHLVGFAEAVATPEVCFSLRNANARIISFYRRKKGFGTFARLNFVEYFPVTAPEIDFDQAVHDVQSVVNLFELASIVPCDDAALLVLSRLESTKTRGLRPSEAAFDFAMDKQAQIALALELDGGFSVPRTKLVSCEADLSDFDVRPAILKPRKAIDIVDGRLEKGPSFIVRSDALSSKARKALSRRAYLMQKYENGVGEGFFGIARDGEIYAGFGHRRLRMMNPSGSGASACVSRTPDVDEIKAVKMFVRNIQWQGPFMVEFLRDNAGRRWFMEFNGRFWGSLALARRCGLDMPRLGFDLLNGKPLPSADRIAEGFARHLGRDLINLLFVLRGPADGVRSDQWPSRLSAIREFFKPHHLRSFYNYDSRQPLFFVKDAIYSISNEVRRFKLWR